MTGEKAATKLPAHSLRVCPEVDTEDLWARVESNSSRALVRFLRRGVMLSGAGGERSEPPAESKHPYVLCDSRDGKDLSGL